MLASRSGSIVLLAPLVGLLAAVVLAATHRATEIPPLRVSRMREETNPTMAAVDRTACQAGMIAHEGIQRQLILTNKRASAVVLMPIRAKRKNFPDGYDKNARFSVKMLIVFCMSSSYLLDANAASGRARIFHAWTLNFCPERETWFIPIPMAVGNLPTNPVSETIQTRTFLFEKRLPTALVKPGTL